MGACQISYFAASVQVRKVVFKGSKKNKTFFVNGVIFCGYKLVKQDMG